MSDGQTDLPHEAGVTTLDVPGMDCPSCVGEIESSVEAELEARIDRLGDDRFATFADGVLVELEERYGATTSIEDRVQELTEQYYRGLEVLRALGEPMTYSENTWAAISRMV